MSRYATELNRRITSGEPVHVTRGWFLEVMSNKDELVLFTDLSLQEQMFFNKTVDAYIAWLETQRQR
jgi:hypothetical protein